MDRIEWATRAAEDLELSPGEAHVLLLLAVHGDENGFSYPGVPKLMEESRYGKTATLKYLRQLEEAGAIERGLGAPRRAADKSPDRRLRTYRLCLDRFATRSDSAENGSRGEPNYEPDRFARRTEKDEFGSRDEPNREVDRFARRSESVREAVRVGSRGGPTLPAPKEGTNRERTGNGLSSPDGELVGSPAGEPDPPDEPGNVLKLEPPPSGKPDSLEARAREVVARVARETGKPWRTPHAHLRARLRDGATVAECVLVAVCKLDEWAGSELERFVRQKTLYSLDKWDGYLSQAIEWDAKGRPSQQKQETGGQRQQRGREQRATNGHLRGASAYSQWGTE